MKQQPYVVVYHKKCIDGITSAAIIGKYINKIEEDLPELSDISYIAMGYDEDISTLIALLESKLKPVLYIVDFSFYMSDLVLLASKCISTLLYDHHASAFKNLINENYIVTKDSEEFRFIKEKDITIVLDNNECGASLLWKQLFPKQDMPSLIKYVKDYDLWRFEDPDTKLINKYLKTLDKKVGIFSSILVAFQNSAFIHSALDEGRVILKYEDKLENDLILEGVTDITIEGIQGLCVNAPYILASSLGHKLACMSGTFGAVWGQRKDGKVFWSLRSCDGAVNEVDVSKLATKFKGGGHKNAAGFELVDVKYNTEKRISLWSRWEESCE